MDFNLLIPVNLEGRHVVEVSGYQQDAPNHAQIWLQVLKADAVQGSEDCTKTKCTDS
jgi:hypothetical protein